MCTLAWKWILEVSISPLQPRRKAQRAFLWPVTRNTGQHTPFFSGLPSPSLGRTIVRYAIRPTLFPFRRSFRRVIVTDECRRRGCPNKTGRFKSIFQLSPRLLMYLSGQRMSLPGGREITMALMYRSNRGTDAFVGRDYFTQTHTCVHGTCTSRAGFSQFRWTPIPPQLSSTGHKRSRTTSCVFGITNTVTKL